MGLATALSTIPGRNAEGQGCFGKNTDVFGRKTLFPLKGCLGFSEVTVIDRLQTSKGSKKTTESDMKIESVSLAALVFLGLTSGALAESTADSADEDVMVISETLGESDEVEANDEAGIELRGNLNCTTKVYNTAATATCSGSGTWRLRIDCKGEPDYVGGWNYQSGGTLKKGGECTFKARGASVESK